MRVDRTWSRRAGVVGAVSGLTLVLAAPGAPLAAELEEVIVTARKREENLQDVPTSITAFSTQAVERAHMSSLADLDMMSPNVILDEQHVGSQGNAAFSMRGISFQDVEKSFDPAVGVMVDGVFLGTASGNLLQMFDVERVEVLRGPQGTLFGKNTIGGLIHVIRSKPTGELGGKARVEVGSYNSIQFDGVLNLGLAETLAAKFVVSTRQREGYFTNLTDAKWDGDFEYRAGGVNLLWTPREDLEIEWRSDIYRDTSQAAPILNLSQPNAALCALAGVCATGDGREPATGDRYTWFSNFPNDSEFESSMHRVTGTWELSDRYTFIAIGALLHTEEDTSSDVDASPVPFFEFIREQDYKQLSGEFRLQGNPTDNLDFVAGVYLWRADYRMHQDFFIGGANGLDQDTEHKTNEWSVFAEGNYHFMERFTLTFGLRYIDEEKQMGSLFQVPGGCPIPGFLGTNLTLFDTLRGGAGTSACPFVLEPFSGDEPKESWDEVIYRVTLKYDWTEDLNTYFTYSTGFRSGGFNGRGNTLDSAAIPYDPETVDNIEVGLKSSWLENRLRLNIAYFHTGYDDMQQDINISGGPSGQQTIVTNAAQSTIQGVEVDAAWLVMDNWTLTGTLGWMDAEFDEFFADLLNTGTPVDNSDLELRRAPDWSFSIDSFYEMPIGPGTASLRINYAWRDDYETVATNEFEGHIDSYGLLNISLAYEYDGYQVTVFGRNVTDEDYYTHVFTVGAGPGELWSFALPREPAVWGVELVKRFD